MPPFRLLQVAGLDFEAVLSRQPLPLVDLCENAPLHAAERIVDAAIEHDVDGVLFSPPAPRDDLPEMMGLAAVESLHDLIESLREQEITVVVAANSNFPFWRRLLGRDAKTRLLIPGECVPFHDRHNRLCADLHGLDSLVIPDSSSQSAGFSIGVAPTLGMTEIGSNVPRGLDYLALGAGARETRRLDRCVAHCPGVPQATHATQPGRHGVTLLTVDGAGGIETEFVSTASVRFESLVAAGEADADLDDLALRMMERLGERSVEASERGWIVSWTIRADGDLLDQLETRRGRSDLLALLPESHDGRMVSHRLTIVPDSSGTVDVPFTTEFRVALDERRERLASTSGRTSLVGLNAAGRHQRRLVELLSRCEAQDVVNQTQRIGLRLSAAVERDAEF